MKSEEITLEPPLAVIRIKREERHNALDEEAIVELLGTVERLECEEGIRAAIITGDGKSFISGADIREMSDISPEEAGIFSDYGHEFVRRMHVSRIAYIAAINGCAFGGGIEVAMACDIALASRNAVFAQSEANLGIIPGWGGTQNLPRRIGMHRALKMMMTTEQIDAEEALRIGLIDRIFESQKELINGAIEIGKRIAEKSPLVIGRIKECVYNGIDCPLGQGMTIEREAFSLCFSTEDQKEGMKAFMEKRKPVFKGR